jgi:hypothetical protein
LQYVRKLNNILFGYRLLFERSLLKRPARFEIKLKRKFRKKFKKIAQFILKRSKRASFTDYSKSRLFKKKRNKRLMRRLNFLFKNVKAKATFKYNTIRNESLKKASLIGF